jgi:hypothetical protein
MAWVLKDAECGGILSVNLADFVVSGRVLFEYLNGLTLA